MSYCYYETSPKDTSKSGFQLLSISLVKDEKSCTLHTHPFTEVFFVVGGEGEFLSKSETYKIKAGDLVIVSPYQEHTERSFKNQSFEYYIISIVDNLFIKNSEGITIFKQFAAFHNKKFFSELFSQLMDEVKNQEGGYEIILKDMIEILMLRINRFGKIHKVEPVYPEMNKLTKECHHIKSYLDTNYSEHITLDSLAELSHVNKYYLAHTFKTYTGISPIQYLNERRMKEACILLKNTDHSISEISIMVGSSSPTYFSKLFKKMYNITPLKYRKNCKREKYNSKINNE